MNRWGAGTPSSEQSFTPPPTPSTPPVQPIQSASPPPPPPPSYQQQYQQPQNTYNQQPQSALHPPVSMGEWLCALLIALIPIVNIVMVFVWAFGSNSNPSKANFFKAYLIFMLIGIVLSIILGVIFAGVFVVIVREFMHLI